MALVAILPSATLSTHRVASIDEQGWFAAEVARKASITRAEAARAVDAVFNAESRAVPQALHETGAPTADPGSWEAAVGIRELARKVWEDPADAGGGLASPHGLLNGQTPLSASRTVDGAKRVREILHALEYGLPV